MLLDLDLGQKMVQKSLGAFSAIFARGVCHASAWVTRSRHLEFCSSARPRQSRVRINYVLLKACVRAVHAFASLLFALSMRPRRPRVRVTAFSSKLHFCAFLPVLYVSFLSSKSFLSYET